MLILGRVAKSDLNSTDAYFATKKLVKYFKTKKKIVPKTPKLQQIRLCDKLPINHKKSTISVFFTQ